MSVVVRLAQPSVGLDRAVEGFLKNRDLAGGGNAERVGWETATARLLPRYLAGRGAGPLFLSSIAPAPARHRATGAGAMT
jgi:hypothetical protein